jgi:hypothetical protein
MVKWATVKTTLEIPDDLFRRTKATAALRGESLKEFVTTALRAHVEALAAEAPRDRGWRSVFGLASPEEVEEIDRIVESGAQERAQDSQLRTRRVSRRREGQDLLRDIAILQRTINRLRGYDLIPRGVHRFRTHQEADEWMTRQMASTHARRSSKTS